MVDGKITKTRPRNDNVLIFKALHEPIISDEVFEAAQNIMSKNPPRPVVDSKRIQNPLAGIVICGICGKPMVRRPYQRPYPDTLMCPRAKCPNVSSDLRRVEQRVISALEVWLEQYKLEWESKDVSPAVKQSEVLKKSFEAQQAEIDKLYKQLSKTHDFLEQGVYNTETFLERSRSISERINIAKESLPKIQSQIDAETAKENNLINVIPKAEKLLETYYTLPTAESKNTMLKEVLEKVVYVKTKRCRKKTDSRDDFEITIFPKIPSQDSRPPA